MTRPPSLWVDRNGHRDPDAGPFSAARWRRQTQEAEARRQAPQEQEPQALPPERKGGRRLIPIMALAAAIAALGLSLVAVVGSRDDQADLLPAAGGSPAPTQIGRVYQSAGPGVVSVQVALAIE